MYTKEEAFLFLSTPQCAGPVVIDDHYDSPRCTIRKPPKRASEVEANSERFKYEVVRDPGALEESSK